MSEAEDEPLNEKWISNGECISDNDDDDATVVAVATIADDFLLKYNQRMEYIIWEFAHSREPIINSSYANLQSLSPEKDVNLYRVIVRKKKSISGGAFVSSLISAKNFNNV